MQYYKKLYKGSSIPEKLMFSLPVKTEQEVAFDKQYEVFEQEIIDAQYVSYLPILKCIEEAKLNSKSLLALNEIGNKLEKRILMGRIISKVAYVSIIIILTLITQELNPRGQNIINSSGFDSIEENLLLTYKMNNSLLNAVKISQNTQNNQTVIELSNVLIKTGRQLILQNIYKRLQLYTLSATSQQHHSGLILDENDKHRLCDSEEAKNNEANAVKSEDSQMVKLTFYNKNTKLKKPIFITKDDLIKPVIKKESNDKKINLNKESNKVELRIDGVREDLTKQYVLNINTFTPASEFSDQIRLEPIHLANSDNKNKLPSPDQISINRLDRDSREPSQYSNRKLKK